jgi:putative phage-type endonuclease
MMQLPAGQILGFETEDDWLRARQRGIGGSDIAAILGLSKPGFTSALQVYYEKTTPIDTHRVSSEEMETAKALEPWVIEQWQKRMQIPVLEIGQKVIIQSDTYPFLLHSPDSLVFERDGEDPVEGLEIKTIRSDRYWDPIPPYYMAQVQHGLLCSGLDKWNVCALVSGQRLIFREVYPDKEMMGTIALRAEQFWNDHVMKGIPPEPDGSDSAGKALQRQWGSSAGTVDIDPELWEAWADMDVRVAQDTRELKRIQQKIQLQMGDHEVAYANGERVIDWKVSTRRSVDVKRLRAEAPDTAEKFMRTDTTRMFRPHRERMDGNG